jgi:hypothetical protein
MTRVPSSVRATVHRRSGGRCEIEGCQRQAQHIHHRKMRSQGGENVATNLLHVCHRCHDNIHANPEASYRAGHLVKSWAPAHPYGGEDDE